MFADRADAGRRLAERLDHLRGQDLVILGLPRGGVPVAYEVARALAAPLAERGYAYAHHGQGQWNGVALLSRVGLDDVARGLPWEPRDEWASRAALGRHQTLTLERDDDGATLAGFDLESGRLVGEFVLFLRSVDHRGGEIGYVLHPDFWGRGLATEGARHLLEIAFGPLDLRPAEFSILMLLADNGPVAQRRLAQALDMAAPNLAATLDRMAGRGWIERVRDTDDRRSQRVHLTPAGERLVHEAQSIAATMEDPALGALSRAERALLVELLRKVAFHRHQISATTTNR